MLAASATAVLACAPHVEHMVGNARQHNMWQTLLLVIPSCQQLQQHVYLKYFYRLLDPAELHLAP